MVFWKWRNIRGGGTEKDKHSGSYDHCNTLSLWSLQHTTAMFPFLCALRSHNSKRSGSHSWRSFEHTTAVFLLLWALRLLNLKHGRLLRWAITAKHYNTSRKGEWEAREHSTTHCNALQRIATHCKGTAARVMGGLFFAKKIQHICLLLLQTRYMKHLRKKERKK